LFDIYKYPDVRGVGYTSPANIEVIGKIAKNRQRGILVLARSQRKPIFPIEDSFFNAM